MREHKVSAAAGRRAEDGCAFLLRFLLYHASACLIIANFCTENQMQHYLWLLLMLAPMCYLMCIRKWTKHFTAALLLHMPVLSAGILIGRDLGEKIIMTVIMMVMLVVSLGMCMSGKKRRESCPALSLLVLLLIGYFVGYYIQDYALRRVMYYESMTYIVVFLVYNSLHNTSEFVELHRDTANFPVGQMTIINRLMVVLFLAVLAAALIIFPQLHLEVLLAPAVQLLGRALAWLLSLVQMERASEQVQTEVNSMGGIPEELLGQASETGLFWVIVEKILIVLVILSMAALIIGGTGYLLYRLYKGFYAGKKENADEKEFLIGELQWLPKDFFRKRKEERVGRDSVNAGIRKLYRRFVKKSFGRREHVPAALTPEEMLLLLTGEPKRKLEGMTARERNRVREIYERARYGEMHCTQEELDEMRRLVSSH